MNKKSFWLYVVIMTMAVIAVVLAIFILVVTDNKKPSNQHFKEEVSSQVTKVTESEEYQYVLKYERETLRIYRNSSHRQESSPPCSQEVRRHQSVGKYTPGLKTEASG